MVQSEYHLFQISRVSYTLLHFPDPLRKPHALSVGVFTHLVPFAAEAPENGGHELLLSDDFLKECVEMFSAPSRGYETGSRTFPPKHLNIVDPLKENNNLGRSVSKGNICFLSITQARPHLICIDH